MALNRLSNPKPGIPWAGIVAFQDHTVFLFDSKSNEGNRPGRFCEGTNKHIEPFKYIPRHLGLRCGHRRVGRPVAMVGLRTHRLKPRRTEGIPRASGNQRMRPQANISK